MRWWALVLCVQLVRAAPSVRTCPPFPGNSSCVIAIPPASTLSVGNCILPGAHCLGDTVITLYDKIGTLLIYNDDGFDSSRCAYCSYLEYTNYDAYNDVITTLHQACYVNTTCSASTVYSVAAATVHAAPGPAAGAGGNGGGGGGTQVSQSVVVNNGQSSTSLWMFVAFSIALLGFMVFLHKQQEPRRKSDSARSTRKHTHVHRHALEKPLDL